MHPERAEKYKNQLSKLDEVLNQSELIGEIGLDFFWAKNVSKIAQEEVFRYILEHCNIFEKYCVIHTKGAEKEIAKILLEYPKAKPLSHFETVLSLTFNFCASCVCVSEAFFS